MNSTGLYITVVTLGTALTLLVGQILYRNGRAFLEDVFDDRDKAVAVNRLLSVLFHLVLLGVLAIISVIDVPVDGATRIVITKLGIVLLILGVAHGATLALLARLRTRRHARGLAEELAAQAEQARFRRATDTYESITGH
jgi:ABC-type nickel/cobalt efflux system permease component RcnA